MSILDHKPTPEQIAWAKANGACREGIEAAESVATFGELERTYRGWAARLPGLTDAERVTLIDASDNPAYWRGRCAVNAPGLTYAERVALIEASDDPAYWRGECAARLPGLTDGQRAELRKDGAK